MKTAILVLILVIGNDFYNALPQQTRYVVLELQYQCSSPHLKALLYSVLLTSAPIPWSWREPF